MAIILLKCNIDIQILTIQAMNPASMTLSMEQRITLLKECGFKNQMSIDSPSDEYLNKLRSRDQQAFSDLVTRYHRQFVSVARSIVGESIAEEVVQEAWVSIYKALPKFEGRSSLKTWLYTIVTNQAKTRLRKESRTIALDTGDIDSGQVSSGYLSDKPFNADGSWSNPPAAWEIESPDAILEEAQLKLCIEHTLSILPEIQRAAFTLRDIEQQSFDDICNMLEVSHSNIRVLLHRARITLMQVIDHYQETGEC